MIALAMDPAGKADDRRNIALAKLATMMGAVGVHAFDPFNFQENGSSGRILDKKLHPQKDNFCKKSA
ncbi:MAG TPA: hypothetical protein VIF12_02930, partial [Micavibrio sp.]